MAINLTNTNVTSIAIKRLSGKAMTSAKKSIPEEPLGSFIQNTTDTIFADKFPFEPTSGSAFLNIIQSASIGEPGTVMYNEFDLVVIPNTSYNNNSVPDASTTLGSKFVFGQNLGDQVNSVLTFHAYALTLKSNFQTLVAAEQSFDLASTPKSLGDVPYKNSFMSTGSSQFQIVPEFVTTLNVDNPYVPTVIDKTGAALNTTDGIDYYLDTAAGILFVQDPKSVFDASTQQVPDKLRAFMFVGKYQSDLTFSADDVGLHFSASEGTGFSLGNDATASFESGSAGITVTATPATNKITIGASTDNVQFANLTGSNLLITNTASITYFETTYESSSIIYSSGSTKFGDTNDDTHVFTGSVSILYTGSGPVGPEYGLQMSGSNFLIDYGNSGSVTLGTHNIGKEIASIFPITGSGLIISQSFTNEETHHNMVKIGETELVDVSGSAGGNLTDSFLINVRSKTLVISSSELNKPAARVEAGNTAFYGSTSNKEVIKISGDALTAGVSDANTTVKASGLALLPGATLTMGVGNNQEDDLSYNASKSLLIGQSVNIDNGAGGAQVKAAFLSNIFPLFKGAVTASHVSSSGDLFASLSLENTAGADVLAVVYDTGSGQFFYTGSYGAGGDTTQLEASASVGIHVSASEGTGFSIGLMQSSSFTSGSGTGLTVTAGTTNNIEFELVGVLSSSAQIATDISGAIDAATGSLSASIVGTDNQVAVTSTGPGNVTIGLPDDVIITGDLTVNGTTTTINTDNLNVEDRYILLGSSSSDNAVGGGIIVQKATTGVGTALHWNDVKEVWAVDIDGAEAKTDTIKVAQASIVFASHSAGTPSGDPLVGGGNDANYKLGQMYLDTADTDSDGNTIWIYAT